MTLPSLTRFGWVDLDSIKYCRKSGLPSVKFLSSPLRRAVRFSTAMRVTLPILGGPTG
jgi:hypothetical protein